MPLVRTIVASAVLLAVGGCRDASKASSHTSPTPSANASSSQETNVTNDAGFFIGTALLEADETIVLELASYDDRIGGIAHAVVRYPKDHPQYQEIAAHVGPLRVGEKKPVRPWD